MRKIFPVCCASAATQRAKSMAQTVRTVIFFFMSFEVSKVEPLLDDFVRPYQHVGRNRQADLLRSYQVNHEVKHRGLFYWQVGRLGTLQDLST